MNLKSAIKEARTGSICVGRKGNNIYKIYRNADYLNTIQVRIEEIKRIKSVSCIDGAISFYHKRVGIYSQKFFPQEMEEMDFIEHPTHFTNRFDRYYGDDIVWDDDTDYTKWSFKL